MRVVLLALVLLLGVFMLVSSRLLPACLVGGTGTFQLSRLHLGSFTVGGQKDVKEIIVVDCWRLEPSSSVYIYIYSFPSTFPQPLCGSLIAGCAILAQSPSAPAVSAFGSFGRLVCRTSSFMKSPLGRTRPRSNARQELVDFDRSREETVDFSPDRTGEAD